MVFKSVVISHNIQYKCTTWLLVIYQMSLFKATHSIVITGRLPQWSNVGLGTSLEGAVVRPEDSWISPESLSL